MSEEMKKSAIEIDEDVVEEKVNGAKTWLKAHKWHLIVGGTCLAIGFIGGKYASTIAEAFAAHPEVVAEAVTETLV
jgi:F0F1-type ATP synthase membrane subunit c/vacuolar-type H+-ATPase subunit K